MSFGIIWNCANWVWPIHRRFFESLTLACFIEINETLTMYNECLLADFPTELCSGVVGLGFWLFWWGFFSQIDVCFLKWQISGKMLWYNVICIGDSVYECVELMAEGYDDCALSRFVLHQCCLHHFFNSLGRILASWTGIRDGQVLGCIKMSL